MRPTSWRSWRASRAGPGQRTAVGRHASARELPARAERLGEAKEGLPGEHREVENRSGRLRPGRAAQSRNWRALRSVPGTGAGPARGADAGARRTAAVLGAGLLVPAKDSEDGDTGDGDDLRRGRVRGPDHERLSATPTPA